MDRNMRIQDEDQLDKLAGHTHTHTEAGPPPEDNRSQGRLSENERHTI